VKCHVHGKNRKFHFCPVYVQLVYSGSLDDPLSQPVTTVTIVITVTIIPTVTETTMTVVIV